MRPILAILLLPCVASADVDPKFMPGATDTERFQNALDVAAKTHDSVLCRGMTIDSAIWQAPEGIKYLEGVGLKGDGVFSSFKIAGAGITVREAKRFRAEDVGFFRDGAKDGAALRFEAVGSSSSLKVSDCSFQGFGTGLTFVASGGADISVTKVSGSTFTDCLKGVVCFGPNVLDPVVDACAFSSCGTAIDFRDGGSNFTVSASGMSHCGEGIVANAGYQGTVSLTSVEDTGTVFRCGGDDAGGWGAPGGFRFFVQDARGITLLADVRCGGTVSVDALKSQGSVRAENRGPATLTVALGGAAVKLPRSSTGKVVFR